MTYIYMYIHLVLIYNSVLMIKWLITVDIRWKLSCIQTPCSCVVTIPVLNLCWISCPYYWTYLKTGLSLCGVINNSIWLVSLQQRAVKHRERRPWQEIGVKPGEASSKPREKNRRKSFLSKPLKGDSDLEILASRSVVSSSQPLVLCCGSLSKWTVVDFNLHSQIYMLRLGERRKLDHR